MIRPLEGRVVAVAEGRQLEELVRMLEAEGAVPLRCPLLNILDAPDPGPVAAWTDELIAGRFDWAVLMTGAAVRTVLPYVFAPAADDGRVADLVRRMAAGDVAAAVFTSSPQVERLFEVAEQRGLGGELRTGLGRTRLAVVGPLVAEALRQRG